MNHFLSDVMSDIKILNNKKLLFLTLCTAIYLPVMFQYSRFSYINNYVVSNADINRVNVYKEIVRQMIGYYVIPAITFFPLLNKFNIKRDQPKKKIIYLSLLLYLVSLLTSDLSFRSVYLFFKYLLFVGAGEELLFRGLFYNVIKEEKSKRMAIVVSGALFGALHSMVTFMLTGSIAKTLIHALSEATGGTVASWFFVYLYEESGSILVPILIHAMLDYSGSNPYGFGFAIIITLIIIINKNWEKLKMHRLFLK